MTSGPPSYQFVKVPPRQNLAGRTQSKLRLTPPSAPGWWRAFLKWSRLSRFFGWAGWPKFFGWSGWSGISKTTAWIGAVVVAVVAFSSLWFNYQQSRITQQGLNITEQGQVTDRFGKAIEHLGSDKMEVKLGGIYSLARLAGDSKADEMTIMEVLGSYVRFNAPAPPAVPVRCARNEDSKPPIDIQAAVTVIARRDPNVADLEPHRVDLGYSCLEGVQLIDVAQLRWAYLAFTDLRAAIFANEDLSGAVLISANLSDAHGEGATLACAQWARASKTPTCSQYANANLTGATLTSAHLSSADLTDAILVGTDLTGADLTAAKLYGADLSGATLTGAQLDGIVYDRSTKWPNGFTPPPSS
jgi:membrane protein implicated in regulation of membrane protease activity